MQGIYKNCFGSKEHNRALRLAKIGKHECRKIEAMYLFCCTRIFLSFPNEKSGYIILAGNNYYKSLAFGGIYIQNVH